MDKIGDLIQVYNSKTNSTDVFEFITNQCPEDYLGEVFKEYYRLSVINPDNADLFLSLTWGIVSRNVEHQIEI